MTESELPLSDHPSRAGLGIIGCGEAARSFHLPAYAERGFRVVGAYDSRPAATEGLCEAFGVEHVYDSLGALLRNQDIQVVDIATFPDVRPTLVRAALEAGKHVLSQKPLAVDVATARALIAEAEARGRLLAVNQNGRWAPPWRCASRMIKDGVIGRVTSVTHLDDRNFAFIVGLPYDKVRHFVISDYSIHWIDITRCWLDAEPTAVRAVEYRTPIQPPESAEPWGASIQLDYADGASAMIRQVGCSLTGKPGASFWIHGTTGCLRGRIGDAGFSGDDWLELERGGNTQRVPLCGRWFNDGFAESMGELLQAIIEGREPSNSAKHHLLSLRMTIAACRSAERDGTPVELAAIDT